MRSTPTPRKARAMATASSGVLPPGAQSCAEMRTDIGRSAGQAARTAAEHHQAAMRTLAREHAETLRRERQLAAQELSTARERPQAQVMHHHPHELNDVEGEQGVPDA